MFNDFNIFNRPFAAGGHMVQNQKYWRAKECAILENKTQLIRKVWFFFVYISQSCHIFLLSMQCFGFCIVWPPSLPPKTLTPFEPVNIYLILLSHTLILIWDVTVGFYWVGEFLKTVIWLSIHVVSLLCVFARPALSIKLKTKHSEAHGFCFLRTSTRQATQVIKKLRIVYN